MRMAVRPFCETAVSGAAQAGSEGTKGHVRRNHNRKRPQHLCGAPSVARATAVSALSARYNTVTYELSHCRMRRQFQLIYEKYLKLSRRQSERPDISLNIL